MCLSSLITLKSLTVRPPARAASCPPAHPPQECNYSRWKADVADLLGSDFDVIANPVLKRIACGRSSEISLILALRRSIAHLVGDVSAAAHGTGWLRVHGNKGAAGVLLTVGQTSLCFIGCHLAAHAQFLRRRHEDMQQLLAGLGFGLRTMDPQTQVHHFFLLGDLNYRLAADPTAGGKEVDPSFNVSVERLIRTADWRKLWQART